MKTRNIDPKLATKQCFATSWGFLYLVFCRICSACKLTRDVRHICIYTRAKYVFWWIVLCRFSAFSEKNWKIYQIYHRIPFICAALSNISWRVYFFRENVSKIWYYFVTDLLLQNMTKDHSPPLTDTFAGLLTFDRPCWITRTNFFISEANSMNPFFYVTHYLPEKSLSTRKVSRPQIWRYACNVKPGKSNMTA